MKPAHALSVVATLALSAAAFATPNPWDFNVFSRSTIGAAGSPYGSDFQGAAGAVGNAYFGGFSLRDVAGSSPSLPRSFYGGADLRLSGQINNGGVETAGLFNVSSGTVFGNVNAGGNLGGTSGTITGNVTLGGIKTAGAGLTITGTLTQNQPFAATIDLAAISAFFLAQSNAAAGLASTTGITNSFGQLTVNTVAGTNIVSISAADLNSAHTFVVNGPGTLIVNVTGSAASLDSTTWTYQGGASSATTLLNYNAATSLTLSGGNIVNILAPNAAVGFTSGHVDGNLIVGSLMGGSFSGGQVNWTGSGFTGVIPAPSAAGLLAVGGLVAMRRRR